MQLKINSMENIIKNSLKEAISYQEYRNLVTGLLKEGKSTGPEQSDDLLNYSKLNNSRMKRLDKTFTLSDRTISCTKNLKKNYTFLVISEGWCGDAAQVLPIINKVAEASDNIELKIVLRDENEDLMGLFLTNGSKSIPKLILLDAEFNVVDTWGPRPSEATKMVAEQKEKFGVLDAEFKERLQVWYNTDKGQNIESDLLQLLGLNCI